jgi:hypothetical protein
VLLSRYGATQKLSASALLIRSDARPKTIKTRARLSSLLLVLFKGVKEAKRLGSEDLNGAVPASHCSARRVCIRFSSLDETGALLDSLTPQLDLKSKGNPLEEKTRLPETKDRGLHFNAGSLLSWELPTSCGASLESAEELKEVVIVVDIISLRLVCLSRCSVL